MTDHPSGAGHGAPAQRSDPDGDARQDAALQQQFQQQWHGWGSPVGVGLALLCVFLGLGALLAGVAALVAAGALFS